MRRPPAARPAGGAARRLPAAAAAPAGGSRTEACARAARDPGTPGLRPDLGTPRGRARHQGPWDPRAEPGKPIS